jgi:hypothetical protein
MEIGVSSSDEGRGSAKRDAGEVSVHRSWVRRGRAASYVFLFLCAGSGLFYGYSSAASGHVLNAVLGGAIALGGSGVALLLLQMMRVASVVVENAEQLDRLGRRLDRFETNLDAALRRQDEETNLSELGRGDPGDLVAASVAAGGYPRLAPAGASEADDDRTMGRTGDRPARFEDRSEERSEEQLADGDSAQLEVPQEAPAAQSLEDRWEEAFRRADLPACRRILEAAAATLDADRLGSMRQGLEGAVRDRKQRLRDEFAALVRAGRFREAIAKGEEIVSLVPDSPMACEFRRIRPHLESRVNGNGGGAGRSSTG